MAGRAIGPVGAVTVVDVMAGRVWCELPRQHSDDCDQQQRGLVVAPDCSCARTRVDLERDAFGRGR